jgi:excisionase family DNA binding protein
MRSLLNMRQVSELLGVSRWTLRDWVRQGQITNVKVGRHLRFREEDVQAFIRRGIRRARAEGRTA